MSKHNFNRSFAIILGINNYKNGIPELETAAPDALKLAQIIQEQHIHLKQQYQAQNKYEVQLLLNQRITLKKLNQLIEDFKKGQIFLDKETVTVNNDDRLLFYFAGHGIALEALDNQDGPVGYLIPQDATLGDSTTYLPMQELHDALNALPCRHMLVILDCCFAGAFRWASLKRDIVPKVTVYKERYDRFISDAAWQVITSAADDQKALDSLGQRGKVIDGDEVHSPFAKALFDALRGGADEGADSNKDGIITATELYSYLRDRVEILTENNYKRQTPGFCPLKKHDKGEFIFLLPNFERDKLADAPPLNVENNPYQGLQSYDEKDSSLFFGRENLIKQLYEHVVAHKQALTVVLGASGTGKSSLMKAGLLLRLRQNSEYQFQILDPMRPGESPLKALAMCFPANTVTAEELAKNEQALANIIQIWSKTHVKTKLLLPVDQFEELITLCKSDKEREQFQKLILNTITKFPDSIHIILTLRLDFERQFQTSVLKDFWNDDTRFVVPPMSQNEFREVIEKPASEKVVYFDPPSLVDELINEVVQMPGALPLLSFTLSELYLKYLGDRTRNNRALTKKDYEELGRVVGSLTQCANQEYEQLVAKNVAYKDTVRRVMLRMIALQGGELARRQVPKSELVYLDKDETERVNTVIKRFSEARLIVEGSNPQGKPYVEPAHDALVQGWNKLLAWKKQDEENLILQRRLTPAAEEWKNIKDQEKQPHVLEKTLGEAESLAIGKIQNWQHNFQRKKQEKRKISQASSEKSVAYLWNDNPRIEQLNQVVNSKNSWLNWIEDNFVRRSILQRNKNTYRFRGVVILAIVVLLALIGWALINLRLSTKNQMLAKTESADGNLRSNQPILDALISSLSAGETLKNQFLLKVLPPIEEEQNQVIRTLRKAVYTVKEENRTNGFPSGVQRIFWDKNDKLLVVSTEKNGTVQVLDKQAKKLPYLAGNGYSVTQIIFSPDGSQLAIGTNNGSLRLWNWQNQQQAKVLQGHQCEDINQSCAITSLSFKQDGSQIVSVAQNGITHLWNLSNNQSRPFPIPPNKIITAGFQPNGQLLFFTTTPDGKTVSVFDSFLRELGKTKQLEAEVDRVVLSPNLEQAVIVRSSTSTVGDESFLWNWRQNDLKKLPGRNFEIHFSQYTNKLAATGFNDGTIRLWDLKTKNMREIKGPQGQIASLNFRSDSSDSKVFATASADGTLRLWDLEEQQPRPLQKLAQLLPKVNSLTFNRDGTLIATQAVDGTIHLLNVSGEQKQQFNGHYPIFNNLRFNHNADQLATISKEGIVGILDLSSHQYRKFPEKYDSGSKLSFSHDGKQLVVTGNDNTNKIVYLLDVSSGKRNDSFPYDKNIGVNNVIWRESDDKILLVGIAAKKTDQSIVLLDVKRGNQIQTIGNEALNGKPKFSRISSNNDGSLSAFVQEDDTVSLWYMDGTKMGEFKNPDRKIKSVVLSPDSSIMATIDNDGTAELRELGKLNALLAKGCARVYKYLQNNPNVSESDRHLCDNVPPTAANPDK